MDGSGGDNVTKRSTRRGAAFLAVLLLTGCSSRAKFGYPTRPSATAPGALTGALHDVCDRLADRGIEPYYEESVTTAITAALRSEMEASGAFARIESLPGCAATPPLDTLRARGIAVVAQPQIDQLKWEVPDYDQIVGTTFVVSLLFGVVGGLAYGMTDTEVFGRVKLEMDLLDVRTGATTERIYTGEAREEMDKLTCDTDETRRKMVGRAFSEAMKPFRADLRALAAGRPLASEAAAATTTP